MQEQFTVPDRSNLTGNALLECKWNAKWNTAAPKELQNFCGVGARCEQEPSSETQGQLVGAGKSRNGGEKKFGCRKVKNDEKSPWGQRLNGPVPNGQGSSGF